MQHSIIEFSDLLYMYFGQVVQVRMWGQGLTIGLVLAAGLLTHTNRQEALNRVVGFYIWHMRTAWPYIVEEYWPLMGYNGETNSIYVMSAGFTVFDLLFVARGTTARKRTAKSETFFVTTIILGVLDSPVIHYPFNFVAHVIHLNLNSFHSLGAGTTRSAVLLIIRKAPQKSRYKFRLYLSYMILLQYITTRCLISNQYPWL
jgi:hypothetical protein